MQHFLPTLQRDSAIPVTRGERAFKGWRRHTLVQKTMHAFHRSLLGKQPNATSRQRVWRPELPKCLSPSGEYGAHVEGLLIRIFLQTLATATSPVKVSASPLEIHRLGVLVQVGSHRAHRFGRRLLVGPTRRAGPVGAWSAAQTIVEWIRSKKIACVSCTPPVGMWIPFVCIENNAVPYNCHLAVAILTPAGFKTMLHSFCTRSVRDVAILLKNAAAQGGDAKTRWTRFRFFLGFFFTMVLGIGISHGYVFHVSWKHVRADLGWELLLLSLGEKV